MKRVIDYVKRSLSLMNFTTIFTKEDRVSLKGEIVIEDLIEGKIIRKSNLVVNTGKDCLAHLLAGYSDYRITTMEFGTGNHNGDPVNGVNPPQPSDSSLDQPFFSKSIEEIQFPEPNKVSFIVTLLPNEGNSSDGSPVSYTEIGLKTYNNKLFSYITEPAIVKTPGRSYKFTWTITFPYL